MAAVGGRYLGYKNLGEFERIQKENDQYFKRTIAVDELYRELSNNEIFEEFKGSTLSNRTFTDIDLDSLIITEDPQEFLATTGVAAGFAVCFKGEVDGKNIFGLCNNSFLPIEEALRRLKDEMLAQGCLEETIEFYILGGKIVVDAPGTDCFLQMHKILSIAEKMNIKGVIFNKSLGPEDGLDVLFTGKKIYYRTQTFFESAEDGPA